MRFSPFFAPRHMVAFDRTSARIPAAPTDRATIASALPLRARRGKIALKRVTRNFCALDETPAWTESVSRTNPDDERNR